MSNASYAYAGVSTLKGEVKVRYANDQMRIKVLQKNGHTDIDLIQLVHPMQKESAVAYLLTIDFARGNPLVQAALDAEVEKRAEPVAKAPKAPKEPKAPSMAKLKAKALAKIATDSAEVNIDPALEDAPF